MNTIRVLFANYPLMIPSTIRLLMVEQEDMELVGECRGPMYILQETGRTNVDAVVCLRERMKIQGRLHKAYRWNTSRHSSSQWRAGRRN